MLHQQPAVTIHSDLATRQSWFGKVVRTEGAFDEESQQLFVVAQIDDPYGKNEGNSLPLKIGQYVSAKINGKRLIGASVNNPQQSYLSGQLRLCCRRQRMLKRKNITYCLAK